MDRSAFLYMDPDVKHDFSQCSTCSMFCKGPNMCSILGVKVEPLASCGMYTPGGPAPASEIDHVSKKVSKETVGYVTGKVRCEHCEYFDEDDNSCLLFRMLNIPDKVNKDGCCNAWEKADDQPSKGSSLKKFIK